MNSKGVTTQPIFQHYKPSKSPQQETEQHRGKAMQKENDVMRRRLKLINEGFVVDEEKYRTFFEIYALLRRTAELSGGEVYLTYDPEVARAYQIYAAGGHVGFVPGGEVHQALAECMERADRVILSAKNGRLFFEFKVEVFQPAAKAPD